MAATISRIDLDDLAETSLDECKGLGNGLPAVNWNGDGNFSGPFLDGSTCPAPSTPNVTFNVNNDTTNDADGDGGKSGSEPDRLSTLAGYDDWAKIQYKLKANGGGAGAGGEFIEATPEIIAASRAFVTEQYRPAPDVDKSGPADAEPGDTLTYTLDASNKFKDGKVANGAAYSVVLTDTKPDSTTQSFDIGLIVLGGSASRSTTYLVPCDTQGRLDADELGVTRGEGLPGQRLLGVRLRDDHGPHARPDAGQDRDGNRERRRGDHLPAHVRRTPAAATPRT